MTYVRPGVTAGTVHCLACKQKRLRLVMWIRQTGDGLAGGSVELHRCLDCGAGQINRAEHDYFRSFDLDERTRSWDGYAFTPPDAEVLDRFVRTRCPAPKDPACPCALHAHLAREVQQLPIAPWPAHPWEPLVGSDLVHATRIEIADDTVRLVRACAEWHPEDLA